MSDNNEKTATVYTMSPNERAKEMLKDCHGSKNMAVWVQQQVIKRFENCYGIKSGYENEVLANLKQIKSYQL